MTNPRASRQNEIVQALGLESDNASKRRWRKWLVWGLAILLLAMLAAWVRSRHSGPAHIEYKTAGITQGDLTVVVSATGNLTPTHEVQVGSELSGIIKSIAVDYNDRVTVGQPLAYLDSTKYEAAVMQSRAALTSAESRLQQTQATALQKEQNLKRLNKAHALSGGKAPSAGELDIATADTLRAKADTAAAQAAIHQAKAVLKIDETNLAKTTIYSPIDGIVLKRNVDPGQTVAATLQTPVLFVLAQDLSRMKLQVDVDEADVGLVREGQIAVFSVDAYAGRTFQAEIIQVRYGSQITNGVVTYTTLLNVANPDLVLRPGMTATAKIEVSKVINTLLVPNTALRFTPPEQAQETKPKAGVVSMLVPLPPAEKSKLTPQGRNRAASQRLWILDNGQPVAVAATVGPTDGTLTVIEESERLRA
ncbi:MAG: efflux RND transporter periplasmic adaptor subunit [Desulfobacterales bacterium]|nr:efflux RND transporter periplasmic adaptor subunit [Desulfobacterales bacterium]